MIAKNTVQYEELYSGKNCLLGQIQELGRSDLFRADSRTSWPVTCDIDDAAHEILYVRRGVLKMRVNGHFCVVPASHAMIICPGEARATIEPGSTIEPCKVDWLVVSLRPGGHFAERQDEQTSPLAGGFQRIPARSFVVSRLVDDYFEHLLAEHRSVRPYRKSAAQWLLRLLLVQLIRDFNDQARLRGQNRPCQSRLIRRALRWMDRRLMEHFTIHDVARAMGRSVTHFHRQFLNEMEITPAAYLTERRIQEAKIMLAEGSLSITDIAFALGFSSSQYFATVFKKHVGVSPSTYRHQCTGAGSPGQSAPHMQA